MTSASTRRRRITTTCTDGSTRGGARAGFSLVEMLISLVLLAGVVLAMAMGTTLVSRSVSDTGARSRAQALADLQIARVRAWPSYGTLSDLTGAAYNGTTGGLVSSTQVAVDSAQGIRTTTVTVTITGQGGSGLKLPVRRRIVVAAP